MPGELIQSLLMAVLLIGTAIAMVPSLVFAAEVIGASWRGPGAATPERRPPGPSVAVLIPAHNEEIGIAATLASIREQLQPQDRLVVVADNCQDQTAALARLAGAEVLERTHLTQRGKGYALDHGVRHLEASPPDVVVMVDADSLLHPGGLAALVAQCLRTRQPAQARYLMLPPAGAGLKTRVAALAWLIKNRVRPLGALGLGWPCQLTGSGMAFPWAVIQAAPLASGHLVEDMQLGLSLAASGTPAAFCDAALVTSEFPQTEEGLSSQRTRWEHGHLGMIAQHGPRLLKQAVRTGNGPLMGLALDLCVPPLTSLVLANILLVVLAMAWSLVTGVWWVAMPALLMLTLLGIGIVMAWRQYGRTTLTGSDMWNIPRYVVGKLPVYLQFFTRRQDSWVRTRRDDGQK